MKIKKGYILAGSAVLLAAGFYLFVWRKKLITEDKKTGWNGIYVGKNIPSIDSTEYSERTLEYYFKIIALKFGINVARITEQLYRIETRNFQSDGFRATLGAGALAHTQAYPFGFSKSTWGEIDKGEMTLPDGRRIPMKVWKEGYWEYPSNNHRYIVFKTLLSGLYFVANYIANGPGLEKYGGGKDYASLVAKMPSPIVDAIGGTVNDQAN